MPLFKVLGYLGVLPFALSALGVLAFDSDGNLGKYAIAIQILYAGLIVSFLSGIHWAHSFPRSSEGQMLLSMIPSVLSLFLIIFTDIILFGNMLSLMPSKILLSLIYIIFTGMYWAIYILDWQHLELEKFPEDYLKFRLTITLIVCAALFTSVIGIWI